MKRVPVAIGIGLIGALAVAAMGAGAAAADQPQRADTLAASARELTSSGDRRTAIVLYEKAYEAAPRADYLREIASLYEALAAGGDPRDIQLAIVYLEKYLAEEGPSAPTADVRARIEKLRVQRSVAPPPGAGPPGFGGPAGTVPVHALAYKAGEEYEVSAGGQTCVTPCTLQLRPGPVELTASNNLLIQVVVPPIPTQIRLLHHDNRKRIAGAVLIPTGILFGATMWATAIPCWSSFSGCGAYPIVAITLWPIVGGAALITGIGLLASSSGTLPADANRVELISRRGLPRLRLASLGVGPIEGGAAAGAGFTF